MVGFNNLDIRLIAHHLSGGLQQFKDQIDPDTHIGGKDHGNGFSGSLQGLFLLVGQSGCADHNGLVMALAKLQMGHGAIGGGEINQHIKICALGQIIHQRHAKGSNTS